MEKKLEIFEMDWVFEKRKVLERNVEIIEVK